MTCHTKEATTLKLLRRGYLTSLESALRGGVLSLSQRVGSWRKQGMKFHEKWVRTPGGARVKAWKAVKG